MIDCVDIALIDSLVCVYAFWAIKKSKESGGEESERKRRPGFYIY